MPSLPIVLGMFIACRKMQTKINDSLAAFTVATAAPPQASRHRSKEPLGKPNDQKCRKRPNIRGYSLALDQLVRLRHIDPLTIQGIQLVQDSFVRTSRLIQLNRSNIFDVPIAFLLSGFRVVVP
jgi:hypothetical protein